MTTILLNDIDNDNSNCQRAQRYQLKPRGKLPTTPGADDNNNENNKDKNDNNGNENNKDNNDNNGNDNNNNG